MKAPFKLGNQRRPLAVTGRLALAISLLGVLPATAQQTPIPATTTIPAATTNATPPAATADPKNAASAASAANGPSTAPAADQEASPPDYTNWVTLGVGSTFVNGDKAQYQHQQDTKNGVFGGVDDFHLQEFVGKTGTFTMDGHALVGNHDYALKLDLTDEKIGYIRAGYREYRTWYDGNGGFYPPNNLSFALSAPYGNDNDLYVDRRCGWIEAGLTLPDLPVFAFRYEYDSRKGLMDSTSWGDTDTSSATTKPTLPADRKIVPTYLGIDETRNIFQGNITDKLDNTNMGMTLRYELDETKDSTFIDLDPLDGHPTTPGDQRFVTDYDIEKNDIFNVHGFSETFFDNHVTFSSGFSYVNTGTDLGGSRVYGAAYNSAYPWPHSYPAPGNSSIGAGFTSLGGFGNTNEYISNMNLMLTPIKDLVFIPAVRVEYDGSNLTDAFIGTANTSKTNHTGLTPEAANSDNWTLSVAQSLEARYTGFRDWSLYALGEWSQDWGNEAWDSEPVLDQVNFNQDWSRLCQKYTIGANWYPLAQLNFGSQYYHETHDYNYHDRLTATPTQYPGYLQDQDFTTDDMNFRATWQALSTLSLVTRYDFQYSTVDTRSDPNFSSGSPSVATTFPVTTVQSCNMTNHIISENASWTPLPRLVLGAGGSYVLNTVDTPVEGLAGVNNIVLDGKNDYWTVDTSAGYALDDKTDLRLQYDYYRATDYLDNAGSAKTAGTTGTYVGLPFGADTEEHNVTATITRQINKSLQVSLKYGFSKYRDGTSGGQDNYVAQLVYVSMKYGF